MTFKVREEQFSCFLNWLYRKINFPVSEAFPAYSFLRYSHCLVYKSIQIHTNSNEICLNMTGKGCRTIEELNPGFNWFDFLYYFHYFITTKEKETGRYTVHISRIDIALDKIDDKKVTFDKLQRYTLKEFFICKCQYYEVDLGNRKNMIYYGSPDSDRYLRIYDKVMEQKIKDKDITWLRYEFQLRDDNATSFYLNLVQSNGDFVKIYFGMLRDFLRFTTTQNDGTHYERYITCRWWENFIGEGESIKQLYLPGDTYDLGRAVHYFNRQCASTVKTILQAYDGDLTALLEMVGESKLNKKQLELLGALEISDKNLGQLQKMDKSLTPTESLAIHKATEEQMLYEQRMENWTALGVGKDAQAAFHSAQIMAELAKQDLPFD